MKYSEKRGNLLIGENASLALGWTPLVYDDNHSRYVFLIGSCREHAGYKPVSYERQLSHLMSTSLGQMSSTEDKCQHLG